MSQQPALKISSPATLARTQLSRPLLAVKALLGKVVAQRAPAAHAEPLPQAVACRGGGAGHRLQLAITRAAAVEMILTGGSAGWMVCVACFPTPSSCCLILGRLCAACPRSSTQRTSTHL